MSLCRLPPLGEELVARLDVAGPRYTSYPTVPEWRPLPTHAADAALARAGADSAPISLYVHIPFCQKLCSYCGCHVIVAREPRKADHYLELLRREAQLLRARLGVKKAIGRLHVGGGTPTFLNEEQLAELHAIMAESFTIAADAELAIEIDPSVTRSSQLALLAELGFRRLSMGVQDLDTDVQRAVGRIQTEDQTRSILNTARAVGFESVNFDLIYGLPYQTPASWYRTIERVAELRPDRISLFSFAHVPRIKPHQRRLPIAELPTGVAKLALFRIGHNGLLDAGYRAIGMDHFALPNDELSRAQEQGRLWRDFQGYSAGRGGAGTLGLGVSSIGDVGGCYLQNVKTLPRYEAELAAGHLPLERGFVRSTDDERRRRIIGELMCAFRVELDENDRAVLAAELERLRPFQEEGLCSVEDGRITVSDAGRLFVRNLAMVFDAYLHGHGAERLQFSRTI